MFLAFVSVAEYAVEVAAIRKLNIDNTRKIGELLGIRFLIEVAVKKCSKRIAIIAVNVVNGWNHRGHETIPNCRLLTIS